MRNPKLLVWNRRKKKVPVGYFFQFYVPARDGGGQNVCECRLDIVLRGRRTRGLPGRSPLVNHPALLDRTFRSIKYGTTAHSFLDFVTANFQFRISADRGRKGDGILLTERHSFLRLAYIFATLAPYVRVGGCLNCSATETRGVQRILPLVGVIHKRAATGPLVRRPRRTTSSLHSQTINSTMFTCGHPLDISHEISMSRR